MDESLAWAAQAVVDRNGTLPGSIVGIVVRVSILIAVVVIVLGPAGKCSGIRGADHCVPAFLRQRRPRTVEEASELRYKDVLEAARAFNRPQGGQP